MLTLKQLKKMEPFKIFANGLTIDNYTGINMANTNRVLRWVACRGNIHDWCIYCYFEDDGWSLEQIHDNGEKVISEQNIKRLVPCTDKAFKMYRY